MTNSNESTTPLPKTDRVYTVLRQRIRDLDLPPGALLRKDELSAEFQVSRAPIGEAIARLTEEGLVSVFPQHGSFVSQISKRDIGGALFMRTGLEVEAIRQAATLRTDAFVGALDANIAAQRATLASGDLDGFYELDEALHAMVFDFIDQARAKKLLDSVRTQLDRVRRLALPSKGRPEATLAEHARLVEAIRMGDPEFAAAAMRAHLAAVTVSIEARLAQHDAGGA